MMSTEKLHAALTEVTDHMVGALHRAEGPIPRYIADQWLEQLLAALSAPAADQAEPGWYCAHCQRGVDPREVTYSEVHQECGRIITDDEPPAAAAPPACNPSTHVVVPIGLVDAAKDLVRMWKESIAQPQPADTGVREAVDVDEIERLKVQQHDAKPITRFNLADALNCAAKYQRINCWNFEDVIAALQSLGLPVESVE